VIRAGEAFKLDPYVVRARNRLWQRQAIFFEPGYVHREGFAHSIQDLCACLARRDTTWNVWQIRSEISFRFFDDHQIATHLINPKRACFRILRSVLGGSSSER